jgi:hypothetical protein
VKAVKASFATFNVVKDAFTTVGVSSGYSWVIFRAEMTASP